MPNGDGMKKFLILAIAYCGVAHASDWRPLTKTDRMEVYIDVSSISHLDKFTKAWIEYSYPSEQAPGWYSNFKKYRSVKSLEYFACPERTSSTVQQVYYSEPMGAGDSVGSFTKPLSQAAFSEAAPDTIGEHMLNYVCALGQQQLKQ